MQLISAQLRELLLGGQANESTWEVLLDEVNETGRVHRKQRDNRVVFMVFVESPLGTVDREASRLDDELVLDHGLI